MLLWYNSTLPYKTKMSQDSGPETLKKQMREMFFKISFLTFVFLCAFFQNPVLWRSRSKNTARWLAADDDVSGWRHGMPVTWSWDSLLRVVVIGRQVVRYIKPRFHYADFPRHGEVGIVEIGLYCAFFVCLFLWSLFAVAIKSSRIVGVSVCVSVSWKCGFHRL